MRRSVRFRHRRSFASGARELELCLLEAVGRDDLVSRIADLMPLLYHSLASIIVCADLASLGERYISASEMTCARA